MSSDAALFFATALLIISLINLVVTLIDKIKK